MYIHSFKNLITIKDFLITFSVLKYLILIEIDAQNVSNNSSDSNLTSLPLDILPTDLTSITNSNVILRKCSSASFSQENLEISSHSHQKFVFKLSKGEPSCSKSEQTEIKVSLAQLYQHLETKEQQYYPEYDTQQVNTTIYKNETFYNETTLSDYEIPEQLENESLQQNPTFSLNLNGILTENIDGSLLFNEIQDYCIQDVSNEDVTFSMCQNSCLSKEKSEKRPCIPKCCEIDKVIDFGGHQTLVGCAHSGEHRWRPILIQDSETENHSEIKPYLFYNAIGCTTLYHIIHENSLEDLQGTPYEAHQAKNFRILTDGSVEFKEKEGWMGVQNKNIPYCVDGFQNYSGKGEKYSGDHSKDVVFIQCVKNDFDDDSHITEDKENIVILYLIIIPFASIFLVLVIVVYILIWSTHNIHGYILFSYICSLFGFYIFLFLSHVKIFPIGSTPCALTGIGIHLFFLLTVFWLTTINFDVWYTFRKLKVGRPSTNLKKYFCYASLSCGVPLLIVFISVILNYKVKEDGSGIIIPNYGTYVCSLSSASVGYYLYLPVGILFGCNILFFISTLYILYGYQRSIGAALKGTSNTKEDQSLRVFVKLFIISGTTWIFEIIGWAVEQNSGMNSSLTIFWLFAFLDVLNVIQAIAIFFIFVWKKVIYEQLWFRYSSLRGMLSLFILGGCTMMPSEDRRPSGASAFTMSTMPRTGTMTNTSANGGRKISSGSVSELIADRNRKISNSSTNSRDDRPFSRSLSSNSKTSSFGDGNNRQSMSTLSETEEEDIDEIIDTTIKA